MDTEKSLIAERAAEWLEQLEHAGPEERARFVKWLKESPQHVWEVLLATSSDVVLRQLLKDAGIDVSILPASNVRSIDRAAGPAGSPSTALRMLTSQSKFSWKAAAVVTFVALISLMTVAIHTVSDRSIRTDSGEWHTTRLADGSILRAGPRTRARINFTDRERIIRLAHGELMLHVAKDHARPLVVKTDLAAARAIGTAFAVRHVEHDRTSITVKEGIVAVSREVSSNVREHSAEAAAAAEAVTLNAGEQVQATSGHLPLTVTQVNLDKELAWTSGRLIFDDETIAEAVQELNLRNEVQLKIQSPELAARPIRGIMRANDPVSFAQLLEGMAGVSVLNDRRGTLLVILHPNGGEIGPQEPEGDF